MIGTAAAELDAAAITEPRLRQDYLLCRELHSRHGRTYFLATRVLPPARRPGVHALYGFARWVDDIVDEPEPGVSAAEQGARLNSIAEDLERALDGHAPREPVLRAVAHTAHRYALPSDHFRAFLRSMRMDLTVTAYRDLAHLREYMYGSAAVIGLKVLPLLGTVVPQQEAAPHAAALGEAFQLTNFLRDVSEDLHRGRVYLPEDVLASHDADRALMEHCAHTRTSDPRVRAALAEFVHINRALYREAQPGIAMLEPVAQPCVATAFRLYRAILDEIEAADYHVWDKRHRVSDSRKLAAALPALARSLWARAGPSRV